MDQAKVNSALNNSSLVNSAFYNPGAGNVWADLVNCAKPAIASHDTLIRQLVATVTEQQRTITTLEQRIRALENPE